MNRRTTVESVTPTRRFRRLLRLLHGTMCARNRLIRTLLALPLVMSVSSTAQANDLEPVEDALVLYVGQDVPEDGGNVIETIDEVISKDVLGETLVHPAGERERSPVAFRDAFPNVACYAAWLPSFERLNRKIRAGEPTPSFFQKLEGYRSESNDLQLCSVDQGPEPPPITIANSAHLALEVSDTAEPDWDAIEYHFARKLGEFVPRKGESFSISARICPRILQIRTPVRAAVRARKHAEEMAKRLRDVATKIQEPRTGLHPTITAAVAGAPTVYFAEDATDFTVNEQYEYNLFDIYFERVSRVGESASDAEPDADSCLSLGTPGRPNALNAELDLDRTLRFVWLDFGGSEIPSPSEDPQIQNVLDKLAGCEPQAEGATDLVVDENATPPEPEIGTEHEGDPGVNTAATAQEPIEGIEHEGDPGVNTAATTQEPIEGTEHEGDPGVNTAATTQEPIEGIEHEGDPGVNTAATTQEPIEGTEHEGDPGVNTAATAQEPIEGTEHEGDPSVNTAATTQEVAQGCNASSEAPDNAMQTLHVIEAYEDIDVLERAAIRIGNTDTATKRAEAVRRLFNEGTHTLVTGFGPVDDFTAVDVGNTVMMEDDETSGPEPGQLSEGDDDYNRTAFVTVLKVPQASADATSLRTATLETLMDGYAYTLAKVRATTGFCVGDDMIRPIRRELTSYPTYFLGKHYEPFKLLPDHKQAVILVCGAHGPHGPLTSGQLGPVLLRALHEHDSRMFQKGNPDIRATYLHRVGEGDARRYYLFGDSILTHFQHNTTARVLQSGNGGGEKSLCKKFPGLRIVKRGSEKDICARTSPTSFKEKHDEPVHRALFDLTLPTTLAEQLACAPTLVDEPAESPTNDSSTATTSAKSASHQPPGCADKDILLDPYDLLMDLKHRAYVFRAAIDVAYEFRQP